MEDVKKKWKDPSRLDELEKGSWSCVGTESCQQRLKVKCTKVLLDQGCELNCILFEFNLF